MKRISSRTFAGLSLRPYLYLAIACGFIVADGSEVQRLNNQLLLREVTQESWAYQFQTSSNLVQWQDVDALHKGDGSTIEHSVPLPEYPQKQVYLRTLQSEIWAPYDIDVDFIKKLAEYDESDGEIVFDPNDRSKIIMTLVEIENGQRLDASIYSTISWTLDESDFNHGTFTLEINRVVYRSPFSADYSIQEMAEISGGDVPHRITADLNYSGANQGSYSTKFYMLSGSLDEQTNGSISSIFPEG